MCYLRILLLILSTAAYGCAAGAPVAIYAVEAVSWVGLGSRIYNTSTGGKVEIKFDKGKITTEQQKRISSLSKIAVSPGCPKNTRIAEALQQGGLVIITPHKVQQVSGANSPFQQRFDVVLTEQEIVCEASKVCGRLGADAILVFSEGPLGAEQSNLADVYFGKKVTVKNSFKALLVSSKSEEILWRSNGQVIVKGGDKVTATEEIDQVVATAVAQKFLIDAGKQ